MSLNKTAHGKVRGRTIELEEDLGLADGQDVEVQVTPVPPPQPPRPSPGGRGRVYRFQFCRLEGLDV